MTKSRGGEGRGNHCKARFSCLKVTRRAKAATHVWVFCGWGGGLDGEKVLQRI